LVENFGCETLSSQLAYIEAYNKLTLYVLGKYFGCDIQKFVQNNIAEDIIKYGKAHPEWTLEYIPVNSQ
jgi:hypothetical protein